MRIKVIIPNASTKFRDSQVEERKKAAEAVGGKVMVAWHSTPSGYGKVADPQLPESLKKGIPAADVPGPHFLVGQIGWAPREEKSNTNRTMY